MRDTGAALDWYLTWATEKRWKCARLHIGPGFDVFMVLHPDVAKTALQKGKCVFCLLPLHESDACNANCLNIVVIGRPKRFHLPQSFAMVR